MLEKVRLLFVPPVSSAAHAAVVATALLVRTKLNVKVTCQAVHAKNARHILVDCIDWLEPTLVIVGSRGLSSLKGCAACFTLRYGNFADQVSTGP